jgi:hypothetical protein
MSKRKVNPAYAPSINPKMWIYACKHPNDYTKIAQYARDIEDTSEYKYSDYISFIQGRQAFERKFWMNVVNRIPLRDAKKKPSFQFQSYIKMHLFGNHYWVPNLSIGYLKNTPFGCDYKPITQMIEDLKSKRVKILQDRATGLIRWPETLNYSQSNLTCIKDFSNFEFRINGGAFGNALPTQKQYNSLSVEVKAPKEFWDNKFWGNGEHLVIRILEKFDNDQGFTVARCECMTRSELYKLQGTQDTHIRFFVAQGRYQGHGLTEAAAMRNIGLQLSKLITLELQ